MAVVTMRQLLDSGVHFGHQTRRWNPKMRRFIFTERNGIYIIDLQQTLSYVDRAYEFVKQTVAHGGTVLFIGTKKQAQEAIDEQATRVGMPFVNQRWLGGMLTNFQTVHKRLTRLKELEAMEQAGGFEGRTKKEILMLSREHEKLDRTLGGIRDMARVPSAVWIVDTKKEHIAVGEARKLNIPVVAILDTNCDPDEVDYPIPGNDDAIRSAALLTKVVAEACREGFQARNQRQNGTEAEPAADAAAERDFAPVGGDGASAPETVPAAPAVDSPDAGGDAPVASPEAEAVASAAGDEVQPTGEEGRPERVAGVADSDGTGSSDAAIDAAPAAGSPSGEAPTS
jgi:small subunit ribosomal protein S2